MSQVNYIKALDLPHYWQSILLSINGMQPITQTNDMPLLFRRFIASLDANTVAKAREKFGDQEGFAVNFDRPFHLYATNSNSVFITTVERLFGSTPKEIINNCPAYIDIIKYMPFLEGFVLLRLLIQQVFDSKHADRDSQTTLINYFTIAMREQQKDSYINQLSWFYRTLLINQTIAIRQTA